jgi:hypothetical protein
MLLETLGAVSHKKNSPPALWKTNSLLCYIQEPVTGHCMAAEVTDCSNSKVCLNGKGMVETRLKSKLHFFWKYNFDIFHALVPFTSRFSYWKREGEQ